MKAEHVKMDAKIGVMYLSREKSKIDSYHQKLEEARFLPWSFQRKYDPVTILDFVPPELWDGTFLLS